MAENLVPDLKAGQICRSEFTVKKSRFITSIGHTRGVEECKAFIARISAEFSDARHNGFAFNGGAAGESGFAGCSDDGEPHGTAGQPMLNVILHCGAGEITAVTTRYFGGILLGTGGLVKAYQDGVKQCLALLKLTAPVAVKKLRLALPLKFYAKAEHELTLAGGEILKREFGAKAVLELCVPAAFCENFKAKTAAACSGQCVFEEI